MDALKCALLVIGEGPGGYVCGIRAGLLGIDTNVVEEARPGGTCLNVRCIPSKALIHAADTFHKMKEAVGGSKIGISSETPKIDFAQTIGWKDGIAERLNTGVSGLLKKAGVRYVPGAAGTASRVLHAPSPG